MRLEITEQFDADLAELEGTLGCPWPVSRLRFGQETNSCSGCVVLTVLASGPYAVSVSLGAHLEDSPDALVLCPGSVVVLARNELV